MKNPASLFEISTLNTTHTQTPMTYQYGFLLINALSKPDICSNKLTTLSRPDSARVKKLTIQYQWQLSCKFNKHADVENI